MLNNRIMLVIVLMLLVQTVPSTTIQAAACPTASVTSGHADERITVDGLKRRYVLYIPATYDPTKPTPLVFSIHGFVSNPEQQQEYSNWEAIADQEPLIVVYPQGTGIPTRWNAGDSEFIGKSTVDDVGFLRQVVGAVAERVCIDPARIFVSGLSNGGGMSNRMACQASDMIAAMGGVAGAYSPVECDIERPVSVIAFHGTADPIVGYHGAASQNLPDIETWAKAWAERDGCPMTPAVLDVTDEIRQTRYMNCEDDAEVVLITIEGGGHTWPGSSLHLDFLGETNMDINATSIMWDFFKRHPMG